MMSRFTDQAQDALQRAQQIMFAKQHTQLDVEHIFLALLQQRNSLPGQIISKLGGDSRLMIQSLETALNTLQSFGANRGVTTNYITLRANHVITGAAEEADRLNDDFISTEHLLLAIATQRDGASVHLLHQAGIDREKIDGLLHELRGDRADWPPAHERRVAEHLRKTIINPPSLAEPKGFSHGIVVTGGRVLFLGGQAALNKEGQVVAPGDVVGQYRQVLINLKEVVEAAGGEMQDIVKMNIFVRDRDDYKAHLKELGQVHRSFFEDYYPATALFEVSRFFEDEVLVEIEGMAVIGEAD